MMTTNKRVFLYDTTLRDGAQTRGVDFSVKDKRQIAGWLDDFGLDYIECGWPGANPTDSEFFANLPALENARAAAFGMTARVGVAPAEDSGLNTVLDNAASCVCLVGKTWGFHVETALRVSLEDNLELISSSVAHVVDQGKEALFDAEHFFDGYKANPEYALKCLRAAHEAGARWLVLCDTNGGTLPHEVDEIVSVVSKEFPKEVLGFHGHNDTGNAIACSLAAVRAGCRMVQGTLSGLGERCGNADLLALMPTLRYKMGYDIGVSDAKLCELGALGKKLDKLLDRQSDTHAPYVGDAAFAHKGGLHASAVARNPALYEHLTPELVGNRREILMSNQAGQANLLMKLEALDIKVEFKDPRLSCLLEMVKEREHEGYAFDRAEGSFAVLALRQLGRLDSPFELQEFNVNNRGVMTPDGRSHISVQAQLRMKVGDVETQATAKGNGPVNALDNALRKALVKHFPELETVSLTDYRVRILDTGTATGATTRVLLESHDTRTNTSWTTIGVSTDVVGASLEALVDSYLFKLNAKAEHNCSVSCDKGTEPVHSKDRRMVEVPKVPVPTRSQRNRRKMVCLLG
ncbi:MAG: citramalate synthase [Bdellovibrionales bacterium]